MRRPVCAGPTLCFLVVAGTPGPAHSLHVLSDPHKRESSFSPHRSDEEVKAQEDPGICLRQEDPGLSPGPLCFSILCAPTSRAWGSETATSAEALARSDPPCRRLLSSLGPSLCLGRCFCWVCLDSHLPFLLPPGPATHHSTKKSSHLPTGLAKKGSGEA